jgi:hypothetical protein
VKPPASGGSGRLYRLCLPGGAVKPPVIFSLRTQNKTPPKAILLPGRRLDLSYTNDLPEVGLVLSLPRSITAVPRTDPYRTKGLPGMQ